MKVLQLVNTRRSFFDQQVRALEERGVDCTTLTVPGEHTTESRHSHTDYLRFQLSVLGCSREYDLVHVNYGLLGPLGLAQPTRPVVLTLWGSDVMGHARWLDWVSRQSARLSDAVVLPSNAMTSHVPGDSRVIPFGVDTDRFRPIPTSRARERVGWPDDDRIVLFPYPEERTVKNYPLAEQVVERVDAELRTMSGVPHEEVPYYMNASDAVLVTSRRESGPMVVKEAAACNVPVVSTDVGFVAEALEAVSGSYVCESRAELVDRLDRVLRRDERTDGREECRSLSLDRMGEQLHDLYGEILGEPGPRGA